MIPTTHGINPGLSNKFYIKEPNTKITIGPHWFNTRIRQYMILEIMFFISLLMIFCRLQTISNQNDRVLEMISSMERKLETLASQKPNQDIRQFDNIKPLEQSVEPRKKEIPPQDSIEKMEPPSLKIKQSTSKTDNSTLEDSISGGAFRFNAADYLLGASVDYFLSSRSSLEENFKFEEANLVLLDRPHPPADKAWCTNAENPSLTIDLAKYTKPISVSYQHSKWNGTIPKEAPKTYDVVACFDCQCKVWEPLASNCHHSQHGAEQICNVSYDKNFPLIGKIQFRFRENYGDPNMTCVSLVRVYGETNTPVKMEKHLDSEKTCADLKWLIKVVECCMKTNAAPSVPNVVRNAQSMIITIASLKKFVIK
ncbi:hypothetical protein B9Z55_015311 [Caenorhabditis nigoni]|uniref:SUN domain-containing protein n=1 Tax=Caenorhabditis nigoni TaxID=1611254 RepID=A0A2G5U9M3_9PELO|nr:hypothetical protein B9Z55_015311 [Caenorhabditis nigoni]